MKSLVSTLIVAAFASVFHVTGVQGQLLGGSWSLGTNRFTTREKHEAICLDNGFRVFGGRSGLDISTSVLESDSWEGITSGSSTNFLWDTVTTFPAFENGLEAFTMDFTNDQYWVFGGRTDNADGVNRFSALSGTQWTEVTLNGGELPDARYRHKSATLANGSFVVMFGQGQTGFLNDVWMFTPTGTGTGSFYKVHDGSGTAPAPRFDPCCSYRSATNSVVCFGGTILSGDVNQVWEFDVDTATWSEKATTATAPSARRLAHCQFYGDSLTVWSGFDSGISNNPTDTDIHELPMTTLAWKQHSQTNGPIARDGGAVCAPANGSAIYLLGGLGTDRIRRNDIWKMELSGTTLTWVEVSSQLSLPPARAEHAAAMIGSDMIVGFGRNAQGKMQDVWKYDTQATTWSLLTSSCPFGARSGAAAVARGDQIWFIGGELANGDLSMSIISYDTNSSVWFEFPAQNVPAGRHRHSAATFEGTRVVVVGGTTVAEDQTDDIFIYIPQTQTWATVSQTGDTMTKRRSAGLVTNPVDGSITVLGGLGGANGEVDMDRYHMSIALESGEYSATISKLTSDIVASSGLKNRSFVRSEAAVIGSGHHFMVCGGAISDAFPVIDDDSCFQYDSATGFNYRMTLPATYTNAYFSTGVYFGHTMYVFGGNYILNGIKQGHIFLATLQKFEFTNVCDGSTATTDNDCVYCSAGTTGSTCEPVPAGSYKSTSAYTAGSLSATVQQCAAGQFAPAAASQSLLFCQPCPEGTYQPNAGASSCIACPDGSNCPVGSTEPLAADTVVGTLPSDTQPPRLGAQEVPFEAYLVVLIVWIVLVLIITCLACCEYRGKKGRAGYYMTEDQSNEAKKIYDEVLLAELNSRIERERDRYIADDDDDEAFLKKCNTFRGLTAGQVSEALQIFAVRCVGMDQAKAEEVVDERTVDLMLDPFEEMGSAFLNYFQFTQVLCAMFEEMKFPSSPETDHHKDIHAKDDGDEEKGKSDQPDPKKSKGKSERPGFEIVDLHPTGHQLYKMGEPLTTMQTRVGGVMSIVGWATIIAVTMLLILLFVYDNVEETMAVLPDIIVKKSITADFSIDVSISGSSNAAECNTAASSASSACISDNTVTPDTYLQEGSASTSCRFQLPRSCIMTYSCNGCIFSNSTANFEFVFSNPDSYSVETVATVNVGSGVRRNFDRAQDGDNQISSITRVATPKTGNIFKGYPATNIPLSLLPTDFTSPRSVLGIDNIETTGYHVSDDNSRNAVNGNEIDVADFRLSRSVPVIVQLTPEKNFLVVSRFLKKDLIGLISSILGVISGLGAATLAAIGFYDTSFRLIKLDVEEEEEEEDKKDNDKGSDKSDKKKKKKFKGIKPAGGDQAADDRDMTDVLISTGMRRQTAKAIMKMISGGGGSGGGGPKEQKSSMRPSV